MQRAYNVYILYQRLQALKIKVGSIISPPTVNKSKEKP